MFIILSVTGKLETPIKWPLGRKDETDYHGQVPSNTKSFKNGGQQGSQQEVNFSKFLKEFSALIPSIFQGFLCQFLAAIKSVKHSKPRMVALRNAMLDKR